MHASVNLDKVFRIFVVLTVIIISFYVLKVSYIYIYPFIVAIVVAFLLNPLVTFIEKRFKLSRSLSTLLVMTILGSVFLSAFFIVTEKLVSGFAALAGHLPDKISYTKQIILNKGQALYDRLLEILPFLKDFQLTETFDQLMDKLSAAAIDQTKTILLTASDTLASFSYLLITMVFIIIAVYMLTKDYFLFKNILVKVIPQKIIVHFRPVLTFTKQSFFGLMKAQLLITTITSLIILICFYFFGINYFFTLSVIIFFVDFIPYIGVGIIFIPWILFLYLTENYMLTIELAALYSVILILRQLMEPKIIAKQIGVHPFIALAILFVGYQIMGLVGILLSPFMLILVSALHKANMFKEVYNYVYKK